MLKCFDPRGPPASPQKKYFQRGWPVRRYRGETAAATALCAKRAPDRCAAPGLPYFSAKRSVPPRAVSFRLYLEKAALALTERWARSAQEQSPVSHGTICIASPPHKLSVKNLLSHADLDRFRAPTCPATKGAVWLDHGGGWRLKMHLSEPWMRGPSWRLQHGKGSAA